MRLEDRIGTKAGRYVLRQLLGVGGMGAVYAADFEALEGKKGAVKILLPQYTENPSVLQRFKNEARAASSLESLSKHIVQIHDIGTLADGSAYIVMELLQGVSLERYLSDRGRLTVHDALRIIAQVAVGLEVAHAAGIIHRDLKPANIFITATDDNPCFAKILDFGIAKLRNDHAAAHRTEVGTLMGTPAYMAAELFQDASRAGVASDVYALATILFQAVTGHLPFHVSPDAGVTAYYFAQESNRPERPAYLPQQVFGAIVAGLALDARDRPGSAKEYVLAVASNVDAEPPFEPSGAEILARYAPRLLQGTDIETVRNQTTDADRVAVLLAPAKGYLSPGATPAPASWRPKPLATSPSVVQASTVRLGPEPAGPVTPAMSERPVSLVSGVPAPGSTTISTASGAIATPHATAPRRGLSWKLLAAAVPVVAAAGIATVIYSRHETSSSPAARAPAAAPSPDAAAHGPTSVSAAPAPQETSIDAASVAGTLRIDTNPSGAALLVDGTANGKTPANLTRPVGSRVKVTVQMRGYKSETHEIVVGAGKESVRYDLERRSGRDAANTPDPTPTSGSGASGSAKVPRFDPDGVGGD